MTQVVHKLGVDQLRRVGLRLGYKVFFVTSMALGLLKGFAGIDHGFRTFQA
jgi:hypothetical protein